MTKRALSLLLTLVMVLSLCVPALAADDGFVAEAPADVIEEAPAAPVEPVAPEAEEPVEEPVADEPAVVEADAPEVAAVMEEEDLPYLVAVGQVSKEAHYELEIALEAAAPYKTKVDAGEMYYSADWPDDGSTVTNILDAEPTKSFDAAYAEAQRNMDGILGLPITGDVSEYSVEDAANALLDMLPEYSGDKDYLKDTPHANMLRIMKSTVIGASDNALEDILVTKAKYTGHTDESTLKSIYTNNSTTTETLAKALDKNLKAFFPDAYVTSLVAAVRAAGALDSDSTYKQVSDVLKLFKAAEDGAEAAAIPTTANAKTLSDAADATEKAQKSYDEADEAGDDALKASRAAQWVGGDNKLKSPGMTSKVKAARDLLDKTTDNDFVSGKLYKDYTTALADVTLTPNTRTIDVVKKQLVMGADKKVASVILTVGRTAVKDSKKYGFAYTMNNLWADLSDNDTTDKDVVTSISKMDVEYSSNNFTDDDGDGIETANITIYPLPKTVDGEKPDTFEKTDTVTVRFFEELPGTNGEYSTSIAKEYLIDLNGDYYAGPVINKEGLVSVDVGVGSSGSGATTGYKGWDLNNYIATAVSSTDAKKGDNIKITVKSSDKFSANDYVDGADNAVELALLDSKGKDIDDVTKIKATDVGTKKLEEITGQNVIEVTDDSKVTVGKMNVVMRVYTNDGEGPVPHEGGTASVTIEPLSKYFGTDTSNPDGILALKDVIKHASKMIKTDYELSATGKAAQYTTLDAAYSKLQSVIADGQALVNKASTMPNTPTNRGLVNDAVQAIARTTTYFTKLAGNREALLEVLMQAQEIEDEGYTYDTWGELQMCIEDASALDSTDLQSDIDEAVADLKAAMAGLTLEQGVNKTPLENAIAAAKALKQADYTPESWAAAKPHIDAAVTAGEAIVNNPLATQAQVNAAIEALRTAQAELVSVKPEGPQPPKSGTGWVYDPETGDYYFFKNNKLVSDYWVGKVDGASAWDGNWYYVDSEGKLVTGMQYIDDLHGGYGWYFLQPTDKNGEIGKMLTGWQWVGGQYGTCYFSAKNGESGKCTYSTELGNWNGTGWVK